jgi:hypothetical protein
MCVFNFLARIHWDLRPITSSASAENFTPKKECHSDRSEGTCSRLPRSTLPFFRAGYNTTVIQKKHALASDKST